MKDSLNIGHLSTAYHTNFILMGEKRLSKDLNRNINWLLFGTGPAMVKAFLNGKIDAGYMGLPPAIIGISNGAPIKCVAGGHVEGTIMIAQDEYKNIKELNNNIGDVLSQFKGETIGVPSRGSIHDVILTHFLNKYHLINEVHIKNYKQAEFIAIDMEKNILAGGVGTPALAVFAQTILKSQLIIPAQYLWPNNPSYGVFFHESYIKNYPEIIIKFLKHHKEASTLLRTDQSIAAEKISNTFGIITKSYAESVLKISPKYCIALTENYVKATMEFVNKLHELGYINENLEVDDIFYFNFVKEVHPEDDHYISLKN
ncbi:MAG: ABC transporter substrate-binding protein [Promethearchaeota archaeon]